MVKKKKEQRNCPSFFQVIGNDYLVTLVIFTLLKSITQKDFLRIPKNFAAYISAPLTRCVQFAVFTALAFLKFCKNSSSFTINN